MGFTTTFYAIFAPIEALAVVSAWPADADATTMARNRKLLIKYLTSEPTDGVTHVGRALRLDSSCDRVNPFDPSQQYSVKVNVALRDVKRMADQVVGGSTVAGHSSYRLSHEYTDYFRDEEFDQVMKMMEVIANFNDYPLTIVCGSDQAELLCPEDGPRYAATLQPPHPPEIILCNLFFDPHDVEVANDLQSLNYDMSSTGWCESQKADDFANFFVSGLTLMHELSHVNDIGAAAGLSLRTYRYNDDYEETSHGTVDVDTIGSEDDKRNGVPMDFYDSARQLEFLWNLHDVEIDVQPPMAYQPLVRTFENAESYAASALQWHFELYCHFSIERGWTSPGF